METLQNVTKTMESTHIHKSNLDVNVSFFYHILIFNVYLILFFLNIIYFYNFAKYFSVVRKF